ncbi:MAG: hypothetical protein GX358_09815 [candidate division WS1 bacterium]|nr:hypothetical protein [candidate division WS1 bacterium]
MHHRFALLALLVLTVYVAGCGGGGGGETPLPNEPPKIIETAVSPSELGFIGGDVTITATVTDDKKVARVRARITGPEGTDTVDMTLTDGQWLAIYSVPANTGFSTVSYTVTITAVDAEDAVSEPASRGITVIGVATPPPPPEL